MESVEHQQVPCHRSGEGVNLRLEQEGLLNNATKGKLDPQWTGPYIVTGLKGLTTVLMWIGITVRKVHVNLVRPLLTEEKRDQTKSTNWTPPVPPWRWSHGPHFWGAVGSVEWPPESWPSCFPSFRLRILSRRLGLGYSSHSTCCTKDHS